jgi:hypothetical protein
MAIVTPVLATQPQLIPTSSEPKQQDTHIGAEVPAPQNEADVQRSSQFAALARKEKMIRQQQRSIEAEKQALKNKQLEIEESVNSKWKSKLSSNTWDTLIEAGLSPDQVTQVMLNQPRPEDIQFQNLEKQIRDLKEAQNQSTEQFKKQQNEQYEQAKKQIGYEVNLLVKNDPQFEALKHYGSQGQNEVVNLIEEVFHKGIPGVYKPGYVMPVEEAATEVENYLISELENSYKKIKKLQPRIQPPEQSGMKQHINSQSQMNTLSNRINPPSRPLSERERKQRAILAFQGKL